MTLWRGYTPDFGRTAEIQALKERVAELEAQLAEREPGRPPEPGPIEVMARAHALSADQRTPWLKIPERTRMLLCGDMRAALTALDPTPAMIEAGVAYIRQLSRQTTDEALADGLFRAMRDAAL